MRKLLARVLPALAVLGVAAPAFAEGESTPAIDVTAATGALTSMKTAFETYMTAATPILVAMIGIGLGIYLAIVGWKLWKKVTNKAT